MGLDHVSVKEVACGRETEVIVERETEIRKNHEALDRQSEQVPQLLVHV